MLLDQYSEWLDVRQYSPRSRRIYVFQVDKFLKCYPDPGSINTEDLKAYLLGLSRRVSFSTTGAIFSILKNFFLFLSISGYEMPHIPENPLKHFAPIKRIKAIPRIIPSDDLQRVLRAPDLNAVRGARDYAIMMFLLEGLRAEEICNLDMQDVYVDGWGITRRLKIRVKGKGRKEREVIAERSGDTEWIWDRWKKKRGPMETSEAFPAYRGVRSIGRLTTNGLYRILQRYSKKTGVKGINPHAWRHTVAVRLLEDGVDIKEIQIRLGHESVATTERYVTGAAILQEGAANSQWIHRLKKADLRHRRRR